MDPKASVLSTTQQRPTLLVVIPFNDLYYITWTGHVLQITIRSIYYGGVTPHHITFLILFQVALVSQISQISHHIVLSIGNYTMTIIICVITIYLAIQSVHVETLNLFC